MGENKIIKYFSSYNIGNRAQKFLPSDRKSLDYEGDFVRITIHK